MRRSCFLLSCLLAPVVALGQVSATQQTSLRIEDLMSASEYRNAGLNKLSTEELRSLNVWITAALTRVAKSAASSSSGSSISTNANAIETKIDGEFHGWDGETLFKLSNGQIWQQAEYSYTYHYAYRPDVVVYKVASGWKMRVEDVDETISVKRIK